MNRRKQSFSRKNSKARDKANSARRRLNIESLESRLAMSAAGLVDVGVQPDGSLSGKIAYINGGHGIENFNTGSGGWGFQRPLLLNMVEDLGNQDQMSFLADYLFRAGATVVPLRPVGHQSNEVVMDNDSPGVTFTGSWSNSSSSIYFGSAGDVPYRFASTSATETAVATYRPDIPEAGFYPVYTWVHDGTDRTEQLYRINHSGGSTEVRVNHRRVGDGMVYLGTYYFEAGTAGSVQISNKSSEAGKVVIADMIRFGNGPGTIDRGFGVSGRDREDELSLYWIQWQVDNSQGIPLSSYRSSLSSDDGSANVSAIPRYATFMNNSADGTLSDRVLVSYHSNAGGGRGVVGLHNTTQGGDTPNQLLLASSLAQEVNNDLVAQNGQFEFNWFNRSNVLFETSFNYGEINNSSINNEFDATIVEVAFHDDATDAALLRDARVRDAVAKATYQGLVKYFNSVDAGATPLGYLPGRVPQVRAVPAGADSVTVAWTAPAANGYNGDAPTGYRIYGSTDGYGFDGGTFVAGAGTLSHTFTGLDSGEGAYYFKVVAVNAAGEGVASEVVAAIPGAVNLPKVLIVNGFDRLDKSLNPTQTVSGGPADRVRPRQSNAYDYAVQAAAAIEGYERTFTVSTASNEMIASGAVSLSDYAAVVWMSGEESTANDTLSTTEQTIVSNYLAAGGKFFVSGSELGYDLDSQNNGRTFYNDQLKADYSADSAGTYSASGAAGSIFAGLNLSFDNGSQFYNVNSADKILPLGGSTAALTYGGAGGTAAVQFADVGTGSRVVNMAIPFESILGADDRMTVMGKVLDYFGLSVEIPPPAPVELILDNDQSSPTFTVTGTWSTVGTGGYNGLTYRTATSPSAATAVWTFTVPFTGAAEIFVYYPAAGNLATNASYLIDPGLGARSAVVNQSVGGGDWVSLGRYTLIAGTRTVTLRANQSFGGDVVIADAVRVVLTAPNADFVHDGLIDGADLLQWQRAFGAASGAGPDNGDADANGTVDAADLAAWEGSFSEVVIAAQAASASFSASVASAAGSFSATTWDSELAEAPFDSSFFASRTAAVRGNSLRNAAAREEERVWSAVSRRSRLASPASGDDEPSAASPKHRAFADLSSASLRWRGESNFADHFGDRLRTDSGDCLRLSDAE